MPAHRLSRRTTITLAVALAVLIATASPAAAAPGDLDPTFDRDGKVTTDFGSDADWAYAMAIQRDGKIVAAGVTEDASGTDFAMARYNTDGTLDPTFSGDGKVTTDFPGSSEAYGVAIQSDGKIVAAGEMGSDFALARYKADGSPDPTFDGDGKVTTDFAGDGDSALDLAIQGDGKIVATGYAHVSRFMDFGVARYNTDGSLDPTFDSDGKVTTDFAGGSDSARGLAIQTDSKIVVAGAAAVPGTVDFALARYNPDGSVDTTFDGDGKVTTDFSTDFATSGDFSEAVAIQGDGKIVAAGKAIFLRETGGITTGDFDFALARYNPDGSLDIDLEHDGTVTTDLGSGQALAIQGDGKIVVAGSANGNFALARYNPDGFLDATFGGGDGTTTADFGGDDWSEAVAIQGDGRIVAAGAADGDFGVARYTVCRRTSSGRSSIPCR